MAFVDSATPTDPNQQNPNGMANPAAGLNPAINQAPQTASATSSQSSAGSGAQGAASTPTSSTTAPVQNLNDYLSANAPQAQQLGQSISQSLGQQYGKIQGDINNASAQFNNGVQSATTPFNSQLLSSAQSDPSKFVSDPNNVSQFQSQLSGKYNGPTDFTQQQGYGNINSEISNAVSNANNANNQQGLQSLVSSVEKNPTPGQSTLDAMLLGGNADAWGQVRQAAAPFSGLSSYLNGQTTANNANAQAAKQTNAATGQSTQAGLNQSASDFTNALNQRVQDASTQLKNYGTVLNKYTGEVQNGGLNGLSTFDQHVLGIDPTIAAIARGVPDVEQGINGTWSNVPTWSSPNLSDAFSIPNVQPGASPSLQNVASSDDYARAQALEQLAGNNLGLPLDASTASQAGSFKVPTALPTFDSQKGAQELYDALNNQWTDAKGVAPTNPADSSQAQSSFTQYQQMMNTLAQYLGKPAFNANYPTATPPPATPPSGPPFLGPPGGDVHAK